MSSWDRQGKAGRRIHKQRRQPDERRHLGILEHKGDYKKRANIFHNKENLIKSLRRKALDKNPDEFYFHMINSRMLDDKHHDIKKRKTPDDAVAKLSRSQDLNYLTTKWVAEKNKISRLKSELQFDDVTESSKPHSHIKFVAVDADDADSDWIPQPVAHSAAICLPKLASDTSLLRKVKLSRKKSYAELHQRQDREAEIRSAIEKLQQQRQQHKQRTQRLKKQSAPQAVVPGNAPKIRQKFERQR